MIRRERVRGEIGYLGLGNLALDDRVKQLSGGETMLAALFSRQPAPYRFGRRLAGARGVG